jgi:diamine N-acetyltransferase
MNELLENANIRLRALEPEDLDILDKLENDATLWSWSCTLAPYSRFELRQYILSVNDFYITKQLRFAVALKQEKKAIGMVDLYDFEPHHKRAAVGITIDKAYQNKGLAGEALSLLCEYSFSFLKLHQLYAFMSVKNESCKRLFTRFGFKKTGLLRDWLQTPDGYEDVLIVSLVAGLSDN